ncbi:MAG: hypothetical protein ABIW03_05705 [Sphingomicrobium sp.]
MPQFFLSRAAAAVALAALSIAPAIAQTAKPAVQQTVSRAQLSANIAAKFKTVDTNGDGILTKSEVDARELIGRQQVVAAIQARVGAQFAKFDANHDGQLGKAEFMAAAPQPRAAAAVGNAFMARLDSNKDGRMTLQEYGAPTLSQFDRLDTNRDGSLSPQERAAAPRQ